MILKADPEELIYGTENTLFKISERPDNSKECPLSIVLHPCDHTRPMECLLCPDTRTGRLSAHTQVISRPQIRALDLALAPLQLRYVSYRADARVRVEA